MRLCKPRWKGCDNTKDSFPKVLIDLHKIADNLTTLIDRYAKLGIAISPVAKGAAGSLEITRLFAPHPVHSIADSHLRNLRRFRDAGIKKPFMLLRSPSPHQAEETVALADFSLNSELLTLRTLDEQAGRYGKSHQVILMFDLGERREGVMPSDALETAREILKLQHIRLAGVGTNLACLNGIQPTKEKMAQLVAVARLIEKECGIHLDLVSGGNSANHDWSLDAQPDNGVNHLRMGESILLGTDPITRAPIQGLAADAFILQVVVIESKRKPSLPEGVVTFTGFGEVPQFTDEGEQNRLLLGIGKQDLEPASCTPLNADIRLVAASSDHLVAHTTDAGRKPGDVLSFRLGYPAMLRCMLSPYVEKIYLHKEAGGVI